jgi:hypothetical protein
MRPQVRIEKYIPALTRPALFSETNPMPVRPIFAAPQAVKALAVQDKIYYHADDAYSDVILPFGQKSKGGDVLDLTISTYAEVVTLDKETTGNKPEKTRTTERKLVDLIRETELPQVHALYRFDVSPGLILSSLRDHEYFKAKTASDDPLTKEINEARYRTDDVRGEWRAFPTLAFTLYLKRVDIQERITLDEVLIPHPTVALALDSLDPSKNMFFGFMHEFPVRNTHLF